MILAHFARKVPLRTYRTLEYGSLTVLALRTNCTQNHRPTGGMV